MNGGGTALARQLHLRIWRAGIFANLLAATLLFVIGSQMRPFMATTEPFAHVVVRQLLIGLIYVGVCLVVSYFIVGWRLSPVRAFLSEASADAA